MSNTIKKSRKAKHNYSFADGKTVDLNSYSATCTVTGNQKKFYHSYLGNLIETKYGNSFTQFEATYVSREGKSLAVNLNKEVKLEEQIDRLYSRIKELKSRVVALSDS